MELGDDSSLQDENTSVDEEVDDLHSTFKHSVRIRSQADFLGVLNIKVTDGQQLVLAESWPSWMFALEALGCHNIRCASQTALPSHWNIEPLDSSEFWKLTNLAGVWEEVWIQGSLEFTKDCIEHLEELSIETGCISFILPAMRKRQVRPMVKGKAVKWIKLAHSALGGVSNSRWELGSTVLFDKQELLNVPNVPRTIGDVLKSTLPGILCGVPDESTGKKRKVDQVV